MNTYNLVYDYRNETASPYWIIPIVLSIVVLFYFTIKKNHLLRHKIYTFLILACVGSPFGLYFFIVNVRENNSIEKMVETGKYSVVEGTVENYELFTGKGAYEEFQVNGVGFRYYKDEIIYGFNAMRPNGGPIKGNGQKVRIGYYSKVENKFEQEKYIILIEEKN